MTQGKNENRYMIGNREVFVTFNEVNESECVLRVGEKIFIISKKLLKAIAEPAP